MMDFVKNTYGGYSVEDLKKLYNEDKIKNSLLYTNELKSRLVKSIEILIENGYGLRVARINSDDIVEVVFFENQLYYAIGKVGTITSPETLLLDCSSMYNNTIKSIPVCNIRYIKIVSDKDKVKGGLLIPLSKLNNIINGSDHPCDCTCGHNWHNVPIIDGDDDVTAAEKVINSRQDELDKEMMAYARYFQAKQEAIWRDKMNNKDLNDSSCKHDPKTIPYDELFKIWEGDKWIYPHGYEPIKQETSNGSTVDMYPYTLPWHCNDNTCGNPIDGGNFCCHHSSIPCNNETTLSPNELNEKFAWHNEFNHCDKKDKPHYPLDQINADTPFNEELDDSRSLRDLRGESQDKPFIFHEYNSGDKTYKDEFKPKLSSKTDNDLDDLRSIKDKKEKEQEKQSSETVDKKSESTQTESNITEEPFNVFDQIHKKTSNDRSYKDSK